MSEEPDNFIFKRQFINAAFVPVIIDILMILSFVLERGMDWDFHTAGVYPRRIESIWGILTMFFVHADWTHLVNNVVSFTVLGSFLYYFYRPIASKILVISYVFSGLILWFIGRESWHIGASGVIYALAFFLFFSGIIRRHAPLIAISLIVTFIYGSLVWHIFPWELRDPISWEGHLAGGIVGVALSAFYRNEGPQKQTTIWDEEDSGEEISDSDKSDNEDNKIEN